MVSRSQQIDNLWVSPWTVSMDCNFKKLRSRCFRARPLRQTNQCWPKSFELCVCTVARYKSLKIKWESRGESLVQFKLKKMWFWDLFILFYVNPLRSTSQMTTLTLVRNVNSFRYASVRLIIFSLFPDCQDLRKLFQKYRNHTLGVPRIRVGVMLELRLSSMLI